jgi:hypothetical protein
MNKMISRKLINIIWSSIEYDKQKIKEGSRLAFIRIGNMGTWKDHGPLPLIFGILYSGCLLDIQVVMISIKHLNTNT